MLEIKNLCVEIGGKNILNGLSLNVGAGEVHVIVGPNGAGKSTLASCILGGVPVKSGDIIFEGEKINDWPIEKRAKAGIFLSFQEPVELPGISVEELLGAVTTRAKVKKYCRMLGLPEDYSARDLNVGFSGGEKKKMEIVQLLMIQPKLAILDEIDSGLDVDAVKKVGKALKSEFKGSLIIITHNAALAKALEPDFVHVLKNQTLAQNLGTCLKTDLDEILKQGFGD